MSVAPFIDKVDHICLAVRDVARACELFVDILGGTFVGGGDNPRLGVRAVQVRLGKIKVEILEPLDPQGWLAGYLDRYGEGFHHLTIYVEDIPAADAAMTEAGFETVDMSTERESWQEAFTRPACSFGALIQLAKPSDPWPAEIPGLELEDILSGKIQVLDNVITWKQSGEQIWPRAGDS